MAKGKRPAPFRTRKLSLSAPMVLQVGTCGRVGHRRTYKTPRGASVPRGVVVFRNKVFALEQRRRAGWCGEQAHPRSIGLEGSAQAEWRPLEQRKAQDGQRRRRTRQHCLRPQRQRPALQQQLLVGPWRLSHRGSPELPSCRRTSRKVRRRHRWRSSTAAWRQPAHW